MSAVSDVTSRAVRRRSGASRGGGRRQCTDAGRHVRTSSRRRTAGLVTTATRGCESCGEAAERRPRGSCEASVRQGRAVATSDGRVQWTGKPAQSCHVSCRRRDGRAVTQRRVQSVRSDIGLRDGGQRTSVATRDELWSIGSQLPVSDLFRLEPRVGTEIRARPTPTLVGVLIARCGGEAGRSAAGPQRNLCLNVFTFGPRSVV